MKRVELSQAEEAVMGIISSYGEDISVIELIELYSKKYNKTYVRTTMITFITRMEKKGYVYRYKKGRNTYVVPLMTREEYVKEKLEKIMERFNISKESIENLI